MAERLGAGDTPHVFTYASCGVRLTQAAARAGIDLAGAKLTLVGEPLTPARVEAIRQAGVEAVPRYGSAEANAIASGCLAPRSADDMHLLADMNALIQPGEAGVPLGLPPRALLLSSLRPAAPVILLNVSLGDQAVVDRPRCAARVHTESLRRVRWELSTRELVSGDSTQRLLVHAFHVQRHRYPSRLRATTHHRQNGRNTGRLLRHGAEVTGIGKARSDLRCEAHRGFVNSDSRPRVRRSVSDGARARRVASFGYDVGPIDPEPRGAILVALDLTPGDAGGMRARSSPTARMRALAASRGRRA